MKDQQQKEKHTHRQSPLADDKKYVQDLIDEIIKKYEFNKDKALSIDKLMMKNNIQAVDEMKYIDKRQWKDDLEVTSHQYDKIENDIDNKLKQMELNREASANWEKIAINETSLGTESYIEEDEEDGEDQKDEEIEDKDDKQLNEYQDVLSEEKKLVKKVQTPERRKEKVSEARQEEKEQKLWQHGFSFDEKKVKAISKGEQEGNGEEVHLTVQNSFDHRDAGVKNLEQKSLAKLKIQIQQEPTPVGAYGGSGNSSARHQTQIIVGQNKKTKLRLNDVMTPPLERFNSSNDDTKSTKIQEIEKIIGKDNLLSRKSLKVKKPNATETAAPEIPEENTWKPLFQGPINTLSPPVLTYDNTGYYIGEQPYDILPVNQSNPKVIIKYTPAKSQKQNEITSFITGPLYKLPSDGNSEDDTQNIQDGFDGYKFQTPTQQELEKKFPNIPPPLTKGNNNKTTGVPLVIETPSHSQMSNSEDHSTKNAELKEMIREKGQTTYLPLSVDEAILPDNTEIRKSKKQSENDLLHSNTENLENKLNMCQKCLQVKSYEKCMVLKCKHTICNQCMNQQLDQFGAESDVQKQFHLQNNPYLQCAVCYYNSIQPPLPVVENPKNNDKIHTIQQMIQDSQQEQIQRIEAQFNVFQEKSARSMAQEAYYKAREQDLLAAARQKAEDAREADFLEKNKKIDLTINLKMDNKTNSTPDQIHVQLPMLTNNHGKLEIDHLIKSPNAQIPVPQKSKEFEKRNFVKSIFMLNKKGMDQMKNLHKQPVAAAGSPKRAAARNAEINLQKAMVKVEELKRFWALNRQMLGDMLECKEAYKCITLTLNNLGLNNKFKGNFSESLRYFKQTLVIEESVKRQLQTKLNSNQRFSHINLQQAYEDLQEINREIASTLINFCSVYSAVGKHQISLQYVQKANAILVNLFVQHSKDQYINAQLNQDFKKIVRVMITSYHNTAVEHEYLKQRKLSYDFYLKAFSLSNRYFGAGNELTILCQTNFNDAKYKYEASLQFEDQLQHDHLIIDMVEGRINSKLQNQINRHKSRKAVHQANLIQAPAVNIQPLSKYNSEAVLRGLKIQNPGQFPAHIDYDQEKSKINNLVHHKNKLTYHNMALKRDFMLKNRHQNKTPQIHRTKKLEQHKIKINNQLNASPGMHLDDFVLNHDPYNNYQSNTESKKIAEAVDNADTLLKIPPHRSGSLSRNDRLPGGPSLNEHYTGGLDISLNERVQNRTQDNSPHIQNVESCTTCQNTSHVQLQQSLDLLKSEIEKLKKDKYSSAIEKVQEQKWSKGWLQEGAANRQHQEPYQQSKYQLPKITNKPNIPIENFLNSSIQRNLLNRQEKKINDSECNDCINDSNDQIPLNIKLIADQTHQNVVNEQINNKLNSMRQGKYNDQTQSNRKSTPPLAVSSSIPYGQADRTNIQNIQNEYYQDVKDLVTRTRKDMSKVDFYSAQIQTPYELQQQQNRNRNDRDILFNHIEIPTCWLSREGEQLLRDHCSNFYKLIQGVQYHQEPQNQLQNKPKLKQFQSILDQIKNNTSQKFIHFIWLQGDPNKNTAPPKQFTDVFLPQWQFYNSVYKLILWTEMEVEEAQNNTRPLLDESTYQIVMDGTLDPKLRADILRLNILRSYHPLVLLEGQKYETYVVNVYADIDMAGLQCMDTLVAEVAYAAQNALKGDCDDASCTTTDAVAIGMNNTKALEVNNSFMVRVRSLVVPRPGQKNFKHCGCGRISATACNTHRNLRFLKGTCEKLLNAVSKAKSLNLQYIKINSYGSINRTKVSGAGFTTTKVHEYLKFLEDHKEEEDLFILPKWYIYPIAKQSRHNIIDDNYVDLIQKEKWASDHDGKHLQRMFSIYCCHVWGPQQYTYRFKHNNIAFKDKFNGQLIKLGEKMINSKVEGERNPFVIESQGQNNDLIGDQKVENPFAKEKQGFHIYPMSKGYGSQARF